MSSLPCVPSTPTLRDGAPCLCHFTCHPRAAGFLPRARTLHTSPKLGYKGQKIHLENVAKIRILGPFMPELWICSSWLCGPGICFDQTPRTSPGADWPLGTMKTLCTRDRPKSRIVVWYVVCCDWHLRSGTDRVAMAPWVLGDLSLYCLVSPKPQPHPRKTAYDHTPASRRAGGKGSHGGGRPGGQLCLGCSCSPGLGFFLRFCL